MYFHGNMKHEKKNRMFLDTIKERLKISFNSLKVDPSFLCFRVTIAEESYHIKANTFF